MPRAYFLQKRKINSKVTSKLQEAIVSKENNMSVKLKTKIKYIKQQ